MKDLGWGKLTPPTTGEPSLVPYFEHYFTQAWEDEASTAKNPLHYVEVYDARTGKAVFLTPNQPSLAMALSHAHEWISTTTARHPSSVPRQSRRQA